MRHINQMSPVDLVERFRRSTEALNDPCRSSMFYNLEKHCGRGVVPEVFDPLRQLCNPERFKDPDYAKMIKYLVHNFGMSFSDELANHMIESLLEVSPYKVKDTDYFDINILQALCFFGCRMNAGQYERSTAVIEEYCDTSADDSLQIVAAAGMQIQRNEGFHTFDSYQPQPHLQLGISKLEEVLVEINEGISDQFQLARLKSIKDIAAWGMYGVILNKDIFLDRSNSYENEAVARLFNALEYTFARLGNAEVRERMNFPARESLDNFTSNCCTFLAVFRDHRDFDGQRYNLMKLQDSVGLNFLKARINGSQDEFVWQVVGILESIGPESRLGPGFENAFAASAAAFTLDEVDIDTIKFANSGRHRQITQGLLYRTIQSRESL